MTIRLIATDLDGTFFGPEHEPTPRTVTALNAARAAGITVVAITGRSHFNSAHLATQDGTDFQWFIGSNGGHRYNYVTDEVEERIIFDRAEALRMVSDLGDGIDDVGFGYEARDELMWDQRFLELVPFTLEGQPRTARLDHVDQLDKIAKVLITHPELEPLELAATARPHVPDHHNVVASGWIFAEITPHGADKGAALARLCGELGVEAHEVVAFGDNQNDLTMLEWAGRGVAMGNALPMVKDTADEVTLTNAEDGVAVVVEDLLSP